MNRNFIVAFAIVIIPVFVSKYVFDFKIPGVAVIVIYLVVYTIVSAIFNVKEVASEVTYPTSGPIGRFGQKGLIFTFGISGLLGFLNPFQLIQIIKQGVGNFKLKLEDNKITKDYKNKVDYRLPFDGQWFVYNGGVEKHNSHSWNVLTQRYAYDFVIVDEDFKRHSAKGTNPDEYFCYDKKD